MADEAIEKVDTDDLETDLEVEQDNAGEQDERDWEAEARDMGWTPKEQFKGDEERWIGAKEFVERGENILPIVNARNRKLQDELKELRPLKDEIAAIRKVMKGMGDNIAEQRREAYEEALTSIRKEMRAAAETGDVERFDELTEREKNLKPPAPQTDDAEPETKTGETPAFREWHAENKWYGTDDELTEFAEGISVGLRNRNRGLSEAEFYAAIADRVKKHFPDKFTNPNREKPAPVSGGRRAAGNGGSSGFASLPPEAKKAFRHFVEDGIYKDDDTSRARYAKAYADMGD